MGRVRTIRRKRAGERRRRRERERDLEATVAPSRSKRQAWHLRHPLPPCPIGSNLLYVVPTSVHTSQRTKHRFNTDGGLTVSLTETCLSFLN